MPEIGATIEIAETGIDLGGIVAGPILPDLLADLGVAGDERTLRLVERRGKRPRRTGVADRAGDLTLEEVASAF